jgi:hypothetical protein
LESSRDIPIQGVLFFAFAAYLVANQPKRPVKQSGPRESRRIIKDSLAVGCNLIGLYPVVPGLSEDKLKALAFAGKAGSLAKFRAD